MGAARQRCYEFTKGEVEALDEGGLDLAAEAEDLERTLPWPLRATFVGVTRSGCGCRES